MPRPSAPVPAARRPFYISDWQSPLVGRAPLANRFPLHGPATFPRPDPKNTSRVGTVCKRPFPPLTLSRRFRHTSTLLHAKWLVISGPIGHSGTPLGTGMGRDAPETHPRAPHTAILGPLERLELWHNFRGGLVRLCAKGMVVMGPFGCGATRCDPETCRNTLVSAFFRLHIGPGGLSCAAASPARRSWANSELCLRTSRAGSVWLDRGSQVLGNGLYRPIRYFPTRDRPLDQRIAPNSTTSKAKGSPHILCEYGALYWQSEISSSTFIIVYAEPQNRRKMWCVEISGLGVHVFGATPTLQTFPTTSDRSQTSYALYEHHMRSSDAVCCPSHRE